VRRLAVALLLAACNAGCGERSLDDPSLVKTTRVLAMVTEPPSAPPGADVVIRALVVDPAARPLELSFTACVGDGLGEFGRRGGGGGGGGPLSDGNAQYGVDRQSEGCVEGAPGVVALPTGDDGSARVPGAFTRALYDDLDALVRTYGDLVDPDTLRRIVQTSGLPLTVGLRVRSEGRELVRAFKRILVFEGEPQNTNPPAPRFALGETWLSGRGVEEPFSCLPESGDGPVVAPGETVTATTDPSDLEWQQTYRVIEVTGEVADRQEGSFYSWFSTAGRFENNDTSAPDEPDNTWTAPAEAGAFPLWVVVRDGHGGTSACRADVDVR